MEGRMRGRGGEVWFNGDREKGGENERVSDGHVSLSSSAAAGANHR